MKIKIILTKAERDYIVQNQNSDLVLTSIGMNLVERCKQVGGAYSLDAETEDYSEFIENLRDEFIWKIRRISNPQPLNSMAKKFLDDYNSLKPMSFLDNHQVKPASFSSSEFDLN